MSECLRHFHYSSEEVINALLTDCLPPHLAAMDRALPAPTMEVAPQDAPMEDAVVPSYSDVSLRDFSSIDKINTIM